MRDGVVGDAMMEMEMVDREWDGMGWGDGNARDDY